jgi:hypothetical protein
MTWVISVVAGAFVGAGLGQLFRVTDRWWTTRKSEMSGEWLEVLPERNEAPHREDRLTIRQSGHLLDIDVRRLVPHAENKKRWAMRGFVQGDVLVAVFYTKTPKDDASSYGVIILHRDTASRSAAWTGVYFRPNGESLSAIEDGSEARPILWKRRSG